MAKPAIGSLLGITSYWFVGFANLLRGMAILLLLCLGVLAIFPTWSYLSQSWRRILPHTEMLQRTGGILMTGTAIAILLGWDVEIQLWLAPWFPRLPL